MATAIIGIGLQPEVTGMLKFEGSNDIGPQIIIELPNVQFAPSAALGMISDAYGLIELTGEVLADTTTGSFGTVTHPDGAATAPDVNNYYVGTGIVSWQGVGDSAYRDVGNVTLFELTPAVERLDHWNHRVGIRRKDFAPVVQQSCTCKVTMDEFTAENLKMVLLGTITAGP